MFTFIIVLIVIISIFLVLLVLMQTSKGAGGLTAAASVVSQSAGTRRVADWIEKSTWTLVGVLFLLCILVTFFIDQDANQFQSPNVQEAQNQIAIDPLASPNNTTPDSLESSFETSVDTTSNQN